LLALAGKELAEEKSLNLKNLITVDGCIGATRDRRPASKTRQRSGWD